MATSPIIIAPDPRLNQVSEPISSIEEGKRIIDAMLQLEKTTQCSGLAAIQIGIPKRAFILNISSYVPENTKMHVFINPKITYFSDDKWAAEEGCLSLPVGRVPVERPENIKVNFIDYDGKEVELQASGWFARGIQHELDHLNGITLFDHIISKLKKDIYMRKLNKYKKSNNIK
jgi:peptide deformylase